MKYELNNVYCTDNVKGMENLPDNYLDITVTSPPYDNLRDYDGTGWCFERFKKLADQMYKKTKPGGVVVWVVGDATIKGGETGSSFKQALYFKQLGFKIFDVLIYEKNGSPFPAKRNGNRYSQIFEYMFVFSKDKEPNNINLINEKIERYETEYLQSNNTKLIKEHNIQIPQQVLNDVILTWGEEGNNVYVPNKLITTMTNDIFVHSDKNITNNDITMLFVDNKKTNEDFFKGFDNFDKDNNKGDVIVIFSKDEIKNNVMSGKSFEIVLGAQKKGYLIHDTMIVSNIDNDSLEENRYQNEIVWMFILSKKTKPKKSELICDKANRWAGYTSFGQATMRDKDGSLKERTIKPVSDFSPRNNVWRFDIKETHITKRSNFWKYNTGKNYSTKDKEAFEHPAIFPEKLVEDSLLSFSKEGDIVFDPFSGSGTTFKVSILMKRKFIGFEIYQKYVDIINTRISKYKNSKEN